ncbi:thioesterase family protein [Mumia sp. zg.B53]|uniref:thioesterase family protein n=1 Tax=unclassified Mumia TaxID=2621872 RepID=UPI001C6EBA25|nr:MULTISPECIES: thioesterase family protein [unclassified Mumia]MBW9210409.1 thioesterase family protein [Mumia sp. zg.B21]MBW9215031.1 thioesterase family protein [Mumia sp. zg.B53]
MSPSVRVEDMAGIEPALALTVPPEFEDENGHVNIRHYFDLHVRAADRTFAALGVDDGYRAARGMSVFSIDHRVRYLDEVLVGQDVAVYVLFLARAAKTVHGVQALFNAGTGALANTFEFVEGHVDLAQRRTAPWPADVAARIDAAIADGKAWPALPHEPGLGLR